MAPSRSHDAAAVPGVANAASGASEEQMWRIAEIAFDPVGTTAENAIRQPHLDAQRAIADTRWRAENNDRLLKRRLP
jgi:hypothetical protein